jgi:YegS/Rv2252/BmrU family lipid kinase
MNDTKRLQLIINPISGTLSKDGMQAVVEQRLGKCGFEVHTFFTEAPGHATRLASQAARDGFYGVLACGGDGTVNEIARALCGTTTALGIIPTGSGNGLARHIEIPVDVESSLDVIAEDRIVNCDYGTAEGTPFFCTFGMGFDAAVSERFARQRRRGLMMYLKSAVDEFVTYSPERYTIMANNQVITEEAFLVVCCNASQYGNNAFIAPEASITDGLLDITIIQKGNPLTRALVGLDMMTGLIGNNALIHSFRAPAATIIRANSGYAHIDGDPCTMPDRINVECHPGQLRIFTTTKQGHFRPFITPASLALRDWTIAVRRLIAKQRAKQRL